MKNNENNTKNNRNNMKTNCNNENDENPKSLALKAANGFDVGQ